MADRDALNTTGDNAVNVGTRQRFPHNHPDGCDAAPCPDCGAHFCECSPEAVEYRYGPFAVLWNQAHREMHPDNMRRRERYNELARAHG